MRDLTGSWGAAGALDADKSSLRWSLLYQSMVGVADEIASWPDFDLCLSECVMHTRQATDDMVARLEGR